MLAFAANCYKICYFEYGGEGSEVGFKSSSVSLLTLSALNIVISFVPTLTFDTIRGRVWYKIIKLNERIQYLLLIFFFIFCSFGSGQQIVESIFKLCLIGIVLTSFQKMKDSRKASPKFVTKISKLWYIYILMSLVLFFNVINFLIGGNLEGYVLMYETLNERKHIYPLILGILSIRYSFYAQLKSLIQHTTYNDFSQSLEAEEVFTTFKEKPNVYKSNLIVSYFFANVMKILKINATDIFSKDNSFKKSFLHKIMSTSVAIREKLQELQSNRVKADL